MTKTNQTGLTVDNETLRTQLAIGKTNDVLIALADDQRWRAMNRSADVMASSIVGQHLMGNDYNATKMNCMTVVMVADQFGWNPITLVTEAYVVKGKVSYSAKTLYAMLRQHPMLKKSLNRLIEWEQPDGSYSADHPQGNDKMRMTISGLISGDDEERTVMCWYKLAAKGGNSPLWTKDPQTQLWYYASRVWGRTWLPDAAQGLYSNDELQDEDMSYPTAIENSVIVEQIENNPVADVDPLSQLEEDADYTTAAEHTEEEIVEHSQEQKDMDKHESRGVDDDFEQANPQDGTLFPNQPGHDE